MIELVTGERGHVVVRRDGRWLASRFDPVSEACAWLARRTAFIDKVKTIFVLGLAAGYHVQQLVQDSAAHIVVVETDSALIEAVGSIHQFQASRVTIEHVRSSRDLRASKAVREGIAGSFTVLVHPASRSFDPDLFKEFAAQLNGREWGALTWQWQVKDGPGFDSTPRLDAKGSALTIYDLEQTELVQNSEERERMLFKALRELVK